MGNSKFSNTFVLNSLWVVVEWWNRPYCCQLFDQRTEYIFLVQQYEHFCKTFRTIYNSLSYKSKYQIHKYDYTNMFYILNVQKITKKVWHPAENLSATFITLHFNNLYIYHGMWKQERRRFYLLNRPYPKVWKSGTTSSTRGEWDSVRHM